jgi:hypothetical protein
MLSVNPPKRRHNSEIFTLAATMTYNLHTAFQYVCRYRRQTGSQRENYLHKEAILASPSL